jgi:hypothetical protein
MTGNSLAPAQAGNSIKASVRDLAVIALDFRHGFDLEKLAAAGVSADDAADAISAIDGQLVPAKVADPGFNSGQAKVLRDRIGMIGRKIKPDLSPDAAKDWVGALVMALSNLPYRISTEAAAEAIHTPFQFLSEVETEIRKKAESVQARFSAAKFRMERLRRQIIDPPPQIEAPKPHVWTQEDIDDLAASDIGKALIRLGVANGWIAENGDGTFSPVPPKENDNEDKIQSQA